jgi:hypothetical protein
MDTASRKPLDWLIVLCANLAVPLMMMWKRVSGELGVATAIISGLAAIALVNTAAIVGIRVRNRRQGRPNSLKFVLGTLTVAVASASVMALGVASSPARNEYLDLAFSSVPLNQIHPERKALIVEFIRRKAANSREYEAIQGQTKALSPPLYSPESLSSPDIIAKTMEQLRRATDADLVYYTKQQEADKEFQTKMGEVDRQFLKDFDGLSSEDFAEAAIMQLEQQWLTSTSALYGYAAEHQREIELRDGKLKFASTAVQMAFNKREQYSKTLYGKLQDRVQGLLREKQEQRARIIMPTDEQVTPP